jgi:uncharacterized membrane protein
MFSKSPKNFFSKDEQRSLIQAIQEAEKNTSGEIRIHLLRSVKGNVMETAKNIFHNIGMTKTQDRNGVLFLLSIKDHQLAILGDYGIHEKVTPDFWDEVRDVVLAEFKQGRFAEGLQKGIQRCGDKLKKFFPYQTNDKNELSDGISS